MAIDMTADERPRPKPAHEMGQDLSGLSVFELQERIDALTGEIQRLQEAKRAKEASRAAADAFFKS